MVGFLARVEGLDVGDGRYLLHQRAVSLLGLPDLPLRLLALGYVAGVDDDPAHGWIVE